MALYRLVHDRFEGIFGLGRASTHRKVSRLARTSAFEVVLFGRDIELTSSSCLELGGFLESAAPLAWDDPKMLPLFSQHAPFDGLADVGSRA